MTAPGTPVAVPAAATGLERHAPLLVVLVALAVSVSGLGNGFAYDDIAIIAERASVREFQAPLRYFQESYWGVGRGNSLYRPLTMLAFAVQDLLGGGHPFVFHLVSVLGYAAVCALVHRLLRQLLAPTPAAIAALVFAVHPVHVETVANGVGQSELWVALALLGAVSRYLRDRMTGPVQPRTGAAILALWGVGLLSKEHAIVLPGLLVAAELAFGGERFARGPAVRAAGWALARRMALLVMAYFLVRFAVIGGVLGDAVHPSLERLSAPQRWLVMLGLLPELVRILLWPARLYADYSPSAVAYLPSPAAWHLVGIAILAAYGALAWWAWRRDRVLLFGLLWLPVTYSTVANVVFAAGVMLAERTLFLPSLTVAVLWGAAAAHAWPALRVQLRPQVQRLVIGGVALVLALAGLQSAARQPVWKDNVTLFSTSVVQMPDNYRAQFAIGEMYGTAKAWAKAEQHLRTADSLFPGYDLIELSLARVLHFDGRCAEALPFYEAVLRARPYAVLALLGRAACLLEVGRYSDARLAATVGVADGAAVAPFREMLTAAESALVAWDTVDARNRFARTGKAAVRSSVPLRVPVLLSAPGVPKAPPRDEQGGRTRDSLPPPTPARQRPATREP